MVIVGSDVGAKIHINPNETDENMMSSLQAESKRLINYFLASLTVPENDLWVNLSPYEKDRIVPEPLSKTELGRDLLPQDYILKQLTASLMYPEDELGEVMIEFIQIFDELNLVDSSELNQTTEGSKTRSLSLKKGTNIPRQLVNDVTILTLRNF